MKVKKATFYKYYNLVKTDPFQMPVDYIHYDIPRKFPLQVDVCLINFIKNPETPLVQKEMMKRYVELMDEASPFDPLTLFRPKDELPETV